MPPADCTHLVQRRNITHFLIRTVCLSGYIRQKDDFIDCWYSNILACLLYVTYVRLGHVHVYVCMCEEMFVSRISYTITIFHCFCSILNYFMAYRVYLSDYLPLDIGTRAAYLSTGANQFALKILKLFI